MRKGTVQLRMPRVARSKTSLTQVSSPMSVGSSVGTHVKRREVEHWQYHLDDNVVSQHPLSTNQKTAIGENPPSNPGSPATNQPKSVVRRNIYAALHEILGRMGALDEADPFSVDSETLGEAEKFLNVASQYRFDPPRVMSHGGDAVTFTWADNGISRYLTVSGDEAQQVDLNTVSRVKCRYDVDLSDPAGREKWVSMFGGEPTSTSVLDDAS